MADERKTPVTQLTDLLGGRSVVFVGMMGCGKTAIGRITANYLGMPFFDADEEIEKAAGMSVADIFATYGEEQFRDGETKVIARLLGEKPCVLALGGGAFVAQHTRDLILEQAVSIWLRADLGVLFSRVMRRPGKRPLLQTDDPKATLAALLEKRERYYSAANIVIDTSMASKNITRDLVLSAVAEYLAKEKK